VSSPNTPGLSGYVLGVGISFVVCAPLILLWSNARLGSEEWLAALLYLPIAVMEVSTYGLPVAVLGVLVLDVTCRRIPWQAVHVLVAGASGVGLAWAWTAVTHLDSIGPPAHAFSVLAGVSAAVGRAAVVPMVRRRRLAPGGVLRVP